MFKMTTSFSIYGLSATDGTPLPLNSLYTPLLRTFWILEGYNIPWVHLTSQLERLLCAKEMVALYEPWWPNRNRRRETFTRLMGRDSILHDNSGLVVMRDGRPVRQFLQAYQACGGTDSGQWLLAAPHDSPDILLSELRTGFGEPAMFVAARSAGHLKAALALDEGAQSALFVHHAHPAAAAFLALADRLAEISAGDGNL
jgi:hypothetical protein